MAVTRTTLAAAVTVNQNFITVASATGFSAGNFVRVDGEDMQVQSSYVSGTTIPVIRGVNGTQTAAHVITAGVVTYLASDDTGPAAQAVSSMQYSGRPVIIQSITATSTVTLPPVGCDARIILNGTTIMNLTLPVPTSDMDGVMLTFIANGVAAHTITATGGFGANTTNSDVMTFHASQRTAFSCVAANGVWNLIGFVAGAATVAGPGLA